MKIVVIYATFFGNTEKVAKMIQQKFGDDAELLHVNNVHKVEPYDCIIIGSPTRGFKPTKQVVDFVKHLDVHEHQKIAFFDTRIYAETVTPRFARTLMKWFGYANDTLEKIASKKGFDVILPSGAFYVTDSEGPLVDTTEQAVVDFVKNIQMNMEEIR